MGVSEKILTFAVTMDRKCLYSTLIAVSLSFMSCQTVVDDEEFLPQTEEQQYAYTVTTAIESQIHMPILSGVMENGDTYHLLVSLVEWNGIKLQSCSKDSIMHLAAVYREGTLTGWRLPTKDEAKVLKEVYLTDPTEGIPEALRKINSTIVNYGGMPIVAYDTVKVKQDAWRYFCSNADSTFSLKKGSTVSYAGQKTSYNLRLVKDTVIPKSEINIEL